MIDLNVRALTDLSLRFVASVKRHGGGILNVASISAFIPGPGMAVYHATKSYVLSFTEALHYELAGEGVQVCALCPGPVPTEFFNRAGIPPHYLPKLLVRSAPRVARAGYQGLMGKQSVIVPGKPNRVFALLPKSLPRAWSLHLRRRVGIGFVETNPLTTLPAYIVSLFTGVALLDALSTRFHPQPQHRRHRTCPAQNGGNANRKASLRYSGPQ